MSLLFTRALFRLPTQGEKKVQATNFIRKSKVSLSFLFFLSSHHHHLLHHLRRRGASQTGERTTKKGTIAIHLHHPFVLSSQTQGTDNNNTSADPRQRDFGGIDILQSFLVWFLLAFQSQQLFFFFSLSLFSCSGLALPLLPCFVWRYWRPTRPPSAPARCRAASPAPRRAP